MEARKIDLNDFVHSGEGANGESLNHRTDSSVMVKLYNAGTPVGKIEAELDFTRKVYSLGIPCPKPGEFVTDGEGRYGIQFQRIVGKKSFSRAVGRTLMKWSDMQGSSLRCVGNFTQPRSLPKGS